MYRAMVLKQPGQALELEKRPLPEPADDQILIRIKACGVCRTDLHIVDGELPDLGHPVIPGHEIVGVIEKIGTAVTRFKAGQRVGVPWLGWTCGVCLFCQKGEENLCDQACFTGYQIEGGYAEYALADQRYCFEIPSSYSDAAAAPLLCAGLIGYRSYIKAGPANKLGLYGFGAAAHILIQIAKFQGRQIYAFTRPGDAEGQDFARQLGAVWSGNSTQSPPTKLDAAIIFAPVGDLVPLALKNVIKGGVVVCAGIHMSDIPSFPYSMLWEERMIASVANLTRRDGLEFFKIAADYPIKTSVECFRLDEANEALDRLRRGQIQGAAVLTMSDS